jgi:hypothetical protein
MLDVGKGGAVLPSESGVGGVGAGGGVAGVAFALGVCGVLESAGDDLAGELTFEL